MKVEVVNKRSYTGNDAHYVGRPTVLGNPFTVKEYGHNVCIDMYKVWLIDQIKRETPVLKKLQELSVWLRHNQHIKLMCWCSPKPCHADVIAAVLIDMTNNSIGYKPESIPILEPL